MNPVRAVVVILLVMSSQGCIALYSKRPVLIETMVAETRQPIPRVPIGVDYSYVMVLNAPDDVEGVTDQNGEVTLELADFSNGTITLHVNQARVRLTKDMVRKGAYVKCRYNRSNMLVTLTPQ